MSIFSGIRKITIKKQNFSDPRKKAHKEKAPWQRDTEEAMTDDEFDEKTYLKGRLPLARQQSAEIPPKHGKFFFSILENIVRVPWFLFIPQIELQVAKRPIWLTLSHGGTERWSILFQKTRINLISFSLLKPHIHLRLNSDAASTDRDLIHMQKSNKNSTSSDLILCLGFSAKLFNDHVFWRKFGPFHFVLD